jgi:hypothetical protein
MSPSFMLSVVSRDVSEGCIKGGLAEATATKQTKERFTPCINSNYLESTSLGRMNMKSEHSEPAFDNFSPTPPSSQWPVCDDLRSPDHFPNFVFDSPGHSPVYVCGGSPSRIFPGSRSDSCDVEDLFLRFSNPADFQFPMKTDLALSSLFGGCSQISAETCSQNSLICGSNGALRSLSQNSLLPSTSCEDFQAPSSSCEEFLPRWDSPALPVKIVAITAKTSLSKKIDLEKLCEVDSTHFGFRVANLGPDCSPEAPRQSQDFRNSIQYLLQFPGVCEESCQTQKKKEKFTGRIFNNGTVTISSIKTQNDIIGTVDQCLQTVVEQIRMAHDASVAVGSIVVQNLEAGYLTFEDPQFSLNLTFPLGFVVNYSKLRSIFKQGDEFVGLDDTKIVINSAKAEQKCGQGVFLKVTQSKLKDLDGGFHASFTIFHTGTVQARATCKNLEEMEFLLSNMYHILNLHRSEIVPAGPEEEFISRRRAKKNSPASVARSHPYPEVPSKAPASRKRKQPTHA